MNLVRLRDALVERHFLLMTGPCMLLEDQLPRYNVFLHRVHCISVPFATQSAL